MFNKNLCDVAFQLGKSSIAKASTTASSFSQSERIERVRKGIMSALANSDIKVRPIYLDVQATTPMVYFTNF